MPRTCPACNRHQLNKRITICSHCERAHRTDIRQIMQLLPDLQAVADRTASPQPRQAGPSPSRGEAPLPLAPSAFDLLGEIREYAINLCLLSGLRPSSSATTSEMLAGLAEADLDGVPGAVQFAESGRELAEAVWRMFIPREPRTLAGWCPECGEKVYAPAESLYAYCGCGRLIDLTELRADTVRMVRSSGYRGTAGELSKWLTGIGLRVSKRTIQRWVSEGRLMVGPADSDGRRDWRIDGILNLLKKGAENR